MSIAPAYQRILTEVRERGDRVPVVGDVFVAIGGGSANPSLGVFCHRSGIRYSHLSFS